MRKRSFVWMVLVLVLIALGPVRAEELPRRIVSMAPSVTEILFALGLGERVVGVTDFCEFPQEAKAKAHVGGLLNPDIERILSLRPDLVVGLPNETTVRKLRAHGLEVLVVRSDTIEEVLDSFLTVGRATGAEGRAKELVGGIKAKLEEAGKLVKGRARPRVLFVVGPDPIFAAGKGSFLDELVRAGGGRNVLAESRVRFPQLGMESVLALAPEVIIDSTVVSSPTEKAVRAQEKLWAKWNGIPAVRDGRVFVLRDNRIIVPGPRLVLAVDDVLGMIHPDLKKSDEGEEK